MSPRHEVLAEGVELWCGDMLDILPTLGEFDACVTDPPYGIGADKAASKNNGKWGWTYYGETDWDIQRPDREAFDAIRKQSAHQIIWGGNYFTDFLPPSMQWLMWDKGQREFSLADFEMAWSSQRKAARAFSYPRARALQDGKVHPTQKPVEVMLWCIDQLPTDVGTILDPFMGSGTTGVAAIKRGKAFYGIEREPKYFDIACRRIGDALKAPDMFVPAPAPKPVQEPLL